MILITAFQAVNFETNLVSIDSKIFTVRYSRFKVRVKESERLCIILILPKVRPEFALAVCIKIPWRFYTH